MAKSDFKIYFKKWLLTQIERPNSTPKKREKFFHKFDHLFSQWLKVLNFIVDLSTHSLRTFSRLHEIKTVYLFVPGWTSEFF